MEASVLEKVGRVSHAQLLADQAQHGRGRLFAGGDLTSRALQTRTRWSYGNASEAGDGGEKRGKRGEGVGRGGRGRSHATTEDGWLGGGGGGRRRVGREFMSLPEMF